MEIMEAQRSVGFLICHYYNGQEEGKEERKRVRKRKRKKKRRCEEKDLVQLFHCFWPKGNEASDKKELSIYGDICHL